MHEHQQMPEYPGLDHSFELLREGYKFIGNKREFLGSNVFKTRLLMQQVYCLTGAEAVALFYDQKKFERANAAPLPLKKTLFGEGGVQGLDDEAHRHRKQMFMQLWTDDSVATLRQLVQQYYARAVNAWEQRDEINLYEEAKEILTLVVCDWVGVPLANDEVAQRSQQLADMYEKAGHVGFSHFKGWVARSHAEEWIKKLVVEVREGQIEVDESRPLHQFIWHKDLNNELLEADVAAVEILNLLRPTVANAVWVAFLALAVHEFPRKADILHRGDQRQLTYFSQEVRRYYPFFPFAAAKVRASFTWSGYHFEQGTLTLLDLYGTNHHPDEWQDPNSFDPSRFEQGKHTPYNFIPQGGGDYSTGHRCAGEWVTLTILEETLDLLVNKISYQLPQQDLSYSLTEFPSLPASRIRMTDIRPRLTA